MPKILEKPRQPAENWQELVDAWLVEIQTIIDQAKIWSQGRGWTTRQDQKVIVEENVGKYEAPILLIHTPQGRLLLEPVARDIVGAEGRFDFCVMPSYDSLALVKFEGGWAFYSPVRQDLCLAWSEQAFEKVASELLSMQ